MSAGGVVAAADDDVASPMPSANEKASSAVVRIRRIFTPPSCHLVLPNRASGAESLRIPSRFCTRSTVDSLFKEVGFKASGNGDYDQ